MFINQIYNGIKRILFGSTMKFTTRKGSSNFYGASWTELYRETLKYPIKLVSIEILTEKEVTGEFRIMVNGEKIFPFGSSNKIDSGITRNFIIPIEISSGSFVEVEIKGSLNDNSVCILSELAVIEEI